MCHTMTLNKLCKAVNVQTWRNDVNQMCIILNYKTRGFFCSLLVLDTISKVFHCCLVEMKFNGF